GTFTQLDGINDAGQIVGEFYYNGNWHGFLYSNGTYTTLDNPAGTGQFGTVITGINNIGTLVGTYDDSNGLSTASSLPRRPQTLQITTLRWRSPATMPWSPRLPPTMPSLSMEITAVSPITARAIRLP